MKQIFLTIMAAIMLVANAPQAVANENDVAFAYQGRVRVNGEPFDGQGQFKLAIVSTSGNNILWSHDGTGHDTSVPESHFTLPVEDGIFNVIVGDTNAGMMPINSTIFNSRTPVKLRVWFNDGSRGFQQLNPDHNLVNLALTALQTRQEDFTLYVDQHAGDDNNNGLTTSTAKKTIQAAVDTLPERVRCNVTIDVADGVYRESVKLFGFTVEPEKVVQILGDENWQPGSASEPTVKITGMASEGDSTPTLDSGLVAVQCSGVVLKGFHLDKFLKSAIQLNNGIYNIANCKITNSAIGATASNCRANFAYVAVSDCSEDGYFISGQAASEMRYCSAVNNAGSGLTINGVSTVNLKGTGRFSNNGAHGYKVQKHSSIIFSLHSPVYSGEASGNGGNGLYLAYQSFSENHTVNNWGLGNSAGNIGTLYGGITTY